MTNEQMNLMYLAGRLLLLMAEHRLRRKRETNMQNP